MVPAPRGTFPEFPASPTGVTNAVPRRPKSPRHPDIYSSSTTMTGGDRINRNASLLSAEHFNHAYDEQGPNVRRRRTRNEMERKERSERSKSSSSKSSSRKKHSHRRHTKVVTPDRLIGCDVECNDSSFKKTKKQAKKYAKGMDSEKNVRGCVRGGEALARQVSSCFLMTADLYQQECETNHQMRGDDVMFFVNEDETLNRKSSEDSNSVTETDTMGGSSFVKEPPEIHNSVRERGRSPTKKDKGRNHQRSEERVVPDEYQMEPPSLKRERSRRSDYNEDDVYTESSTPYRSNRGIRYPQAKAVNDRSRMQAPSPQRGHLRRPRGTYDAEDENANLDVTFDRVGPPKGVHDHLDCDDLRSRRLQLFREDQKDNSRAKYSRALEDLLQQDRTIISLQTQLAETKRMLHQTTAELRSSRDVPTMRYNPMATTSKTMYRERIDMETKLQREMMENEKLMRRISQLQDETEHLTASLNNAKDGARDAQQRMERSFSRDRTEHMEQRPPSRGPTQHMEERPPSRGPTQHMEERPASRGPTQHMERPLSRGPTRSRASPKIFEEDSAVEVQRGSPTPLEGETRTDSPVENAKKDGEAELPSGRRIASTDSAGKEAQGEQKQTLITPSRDQRRAGTPETKVKEDASKEQYESPEVKKTAKDTGAELVKTDVGTDSPRTRLKTYLNRVRSKHQNARSQEAESHFEEQKGAGSPKSPPSANREVLTADALKKLLNDDLEVKAPDERAVTPKSENKSKHKSAGRPGSQEGNQSQVTSKAQAEESAVKAQSDSPKKAESSTVPGATTPTKSAQRRVSRSLSRERARTSSNGSPKINQEVDAVEIEPGSPKRASPTLETTESPSGSDERSKSPDEYPYKSSTIMSLKTEIFNLRTQLAEARATALSVEQEKQTLGKKHEAAEEESEKLKETVEQLQKDVRVLKAMACEKPKSGNEEAKRLREEIDDIKGMLEQSKMAASEISQQKQRLEEELTETQTEADKLRSEASRFMRELERTKQDADRKVKDTEKKAQSLRGQLEKSSKTASEVSQQKQKLEEELTETQTEATELRSQVSRFMQELEKTKKDADKKVKVTEEEAKKLQEDVKAMKEKLAERNTEIISQASEHLKERQKVEEELLQTKQAAEQLQRKVISLDDFVAVAESESESLRQRLKHERKGERRPSFAQLINRTLSSENDNRLWDALRKKLESSDN